ncbi:isoaspartyl peptidase/L-asparaginase family protein [Pelagibacterium sp. H642]|uniref:isoaspartyl peptidase/L-asparaginase family protein n=1 Tax=Pelagibacterium sp. H642 TaxID=1881069 RepID=UPI002814DA47|nr:isoaspartyl peptidase/L-asparaginase family protein [Pelagibacterium sp. H642]
MHGGAKDIEPSEEAANREGCLKALECGRDILGQGGSAIEAVEAAIRQLETDPTFNAGYGSALTADGEIEMCSGLMEGNSFNVGAVAVIKGVRHPISVARSMLFDDTILLAGEGARRYAVEKGLELCEPAELDTTHKAHLLKRPLSHDTVGCVALDTTGLLVAGTSTGGIEGALPGRVGDSPQPGCGYYADNRVGGVALSGDGEEIARIALASRTMGALEPLAPDAAIRQMLPLVGALEGEAGVIVLTPEGEIGWDHNSREFAVAYATSEKPEPRAYLRKSEET